MFTVKPYSVIGKKIDIQTEAVNELVKISDDASKQYCIMPKKFMDTRVLTESKFLKCMKMIFGLLLIQNVAQHGHKK